MTLSVCLIFLAVITCLVMGAMENNLLNQKMGAANEAQITAFNSAEAGIVTQEAKINGQAVDLSSIKGQVDAEITGKTMNDCQEQILTLVSTAVYQNARVTLTAAYLQSRQPPLPGCAQLSRRLWWRQEDSVI
jgi:Tfp pilus assembly protein PilX